MFFFLSCIMFYVYSKIYVITNVIIQCLIYVCILFLSRNKYLNVKNVMQIFISSASTACSRTNISSYNRRISYG